jgi:hypothetical protein
MIVWSLMIRGSLQLVAPTITKLGEGLEQFKAKGMITPELFDDMDDYLYRGFRSVVINGESYYELTEIEI